MLKNYKIKNNGVVYHGGVKFTNDTLTDKKAEELLEKQPGLERSIIKTSSTTVSKNESGSSKK